MRVRLIAVIVVLLAAFAAVGTAEYRGNTKSKVFHSSSCRYFTCKNCTAVFGSAEEAIQRGYHACGLCRPASSSRSAEEVDGGYSGNTNTRKFHASGCRYYSCKNCTARFASRAAAIEAGYSPGGCCNP